MIAAVALLSTTQHASTHLDVSAVTGRNTPLGGMRTFGDDSLAEWMWAIRVPQMVDEEASVVAWRWPGRSERWQLGVAAGVPRLRHARCTRRLSAMSLVALRSVHKRFGETTDVLRGIDLEIGARDTVAVLGPSGSGKSTLLDVIGGLLPPSAGQVLFDGADLAALDADRLAALRNREIGFVFQAHHLLPQCSALENVLVPTLVRPDRTARRAAVGRARALLHEVGLGDRVDHRPAQLSGGECQRVAVVRALINEPRLVLADEPTGSLDARAADRLGDLLCELGEQRAVALVTVTHSRRLAARMQRVLELRDGVLVAADVPA